MTTLNILMSFPIKSLKEVANHFDDGSISSIVRGNNDNYLGVIALNGNLAEGLTFIKECGGSIDDISMGNIDIAAKVARHQMPAASTPEAKGKMTTREKIQKVMQSNWLSIPELEKATGKPVATLRFHFTQFKKNKKLMTRRGSDGRKVYRVKAA